MCGCGEKKGPKVPYLHDFKPVIGWRVWLKGGGTMDSATNEPQDVPDEVLVLVGYEGGEYKHIHDGSDWYFWNGNLCGCMAEFVEPRPLNPNLSHATPGEWLSPDPILKRFPYAVIRKGIWANSTEYDLAQHEALNSIWP